MSQPPKLLSQLQEANKYTEALTQAEGSSSLKADSFVLHYGSPASTWAVLTEFRQQRDRAGKADGFMTDGFDDIVTRSCLLDSRSKKLGAGKAEASWKWSLLGK